eukprot:2696049-Amphidinium_carterae.1
MAYKARIIVLVSYDIPGELWHQRLVLSPINIRPGHYIILTPKLTQWRYLRGAIIEHEQRSCRHTSCRTGWSRPSRAPRPCAQNSTGGVLRGESEASAWRTLCADGNIQYDDVVEEPGAGVVQGNRGLSEVEGRWVPCELVPSAATQIVEYWRCSY